MKNKDWQYKLAEVLSKHNADDHLLDACDCPEPLDPVKHNCAYGDVFKIVNKLLKQQKQQLIADICVDIASFSPLSEKQTKNLIKVLRSY